MSQETEHEHDSSAQPKTKKKEKALPYTEERAPDDVLLDVQHVAGYTLRPMSFGKMATMMPLVATLADTVAGQLPQSLEELTPNSIAIFCMVNMERLIPLIAMYVDAPEEDIRNLPANDGTRLAFTIWVMNARTLMDFFVLGRQVAPQ